MTGYFDRLASWTAPTVRGFAPRSTHTSSTPVAHPVDPFFVDPFSESEVDAPPEADASPEPDPIPSVEPWYEGGSRPTLEAGRGTSWTPEATPATTTLHAAAKEPETSEVGTRAASPTTVRSVPVFPNRSGLRESAPNHADRSPSLSSAHPESTPGDLGTRLPERGAGRFSEQRVASRARHAELPRDTETDTRQLPRETFSSLPAREPNPLQASTSASESSSRIESAAPPNAIARAQGYDRVLREVRRWITEPDAANLEQTTPEATAGAPAPIEIAIGEITVQVEPPRAAPEPQSARANRAAAPRATRSGWLLRHYVRS